MLEIALGDQDFLRVGSTLSKFCSLTWEIGQYQEAKCFFCDTGLGKIISDGVIGLSRSFIAAGSNSVIVWPVNNESTAFLMTAFYQELETTG